MYSCGAQLTLSGIEDDAHFSLAFASMSSMRAEWRDVKLDLSFSSQKGGGGFALLCLLVGKDWVVSSRGEL